MLTFVTVWVLTVVNNQYSAPVVYQHTYATQQICEKRAKYYKKMWYEANCDFQQVPVYIPKK